MNIPLALTDSTSGSAGATLSACTITNGTITGTADGALETVGATNGGDVSGAIMNNFKECQAGLAAANNSIASLAAKVNQIVAILRVVS